jgi:hypothetical protein
MKNLIKNLYSFFLKNRRSGTTTLIQKIASKYDVYVIVPNSQSKENFGKSGITFNDLSTDKFNGLEPKPILVDNHTMLEILNYFDDRINELKNEINDRDILLNSIRESFIMFDSRFERKMR